MDKVNLNEKLAQFCDQWKPKIVGELNGQLVKLVKFQGPFVWHHHDQEDELFLVVKGRFRMEFRDRHIWLEEGEFLIVPRGVEHRPVADEKEYPTNETTYGNLAFDRVVDLQTGLPCRETLHARRTRRSSSSFPTGSVRRNRRQP